MKGTEDKSESDRNSGESKSRDDSVDGYLGESGVEGDHSLLPGHANPRLVCFCSSWYA